MARATLEMFLKLTGANKTSQGLDKVSKSTKELDKDVKNSAKQNEQFAAGMSGLGATAIVGAAGLAAKSLLDFSLSAIQAASSAQEAAGAFGTTFGGAAEKLNKQLAENANLFGLTTAEAQQLISVFGSVAQGIGFTQQESADLSSELFNLAGDIASFNNITAAISQCPRDAKINFVTHSMGGILVRQYLSTNEIPSLRRVVMLGPPNKGSQVVDTLKDMPGFKLINGPAGMQLGTDYLSVPNKLGAANFDVGIIAGTRSINLILSTLLPSPNDGKVSVENTKLEGMSDHISLPVTHPFMMSNNEVITQVLHYLTYGSFNR
jgi:hypothetical protein